jgi:hypothetical protein
MSWIAEETMDLDQLTNKDLNDFERLSTELLAVITTAKWQDTLLTDLLEELQQQAAKLRRARFDADDTEFKSY